jgi:hypothetical protein
MSMGDAYEGAGGRENSELSALRCAGAAAVMEGMSLAGASRCQAVPAARRSRRAAIRAASRFFVEEAIPVKFSAESNLESTPLRGSRESSAADGTSGIDNRNFRVYSQKTPYGFP